MILNEYLVYIQDHLIDNYEIKPSDIEGVGAFSKEPFEKGAFINFCAEPRQIFHDGIKVHSMINSFGKYINHSKNPSCHVKRIGPKHAVFTSRKLNAGEEITVDYTTTPEFAQPDWDWK